MNLTLPEGAVQFAAAAERAILDHGGTELARRAEADPALRTGEVKRMLDSLGVGDLDPRVDLEAAAMAAAVVRVAGRYVLPFPVVGFALARPGEGTPVALASSSPLRVDHGDLFANWLLYDFAGGRTEASPCAPALSTRLAPFATDLTGQGTPVPTGSSEVELLCVLWASYLLGLSENALALAVAHVRSRVQYGRPLAELQAVRFEIADAIVAVDGLREMVHFSLWRAATHPGHALTDALAVRLSALEVAQPVLRAAQQLHGAAGLSDEYDISVLVRHAQPALRLPVDSDAMSDILFEAVSTHGFETLFPLRTVAGEPR